MSEWYEKADYFMIVSKNLWTLGASIFITIIVSLEQSHKGLMLLITDFLDVKWDIPVS